MRDGELVSGAVAVVDVRIVALRGRGAEDCVMGGVDTDWTDIVESKGRAIVRHFSNPF